MPYQNANDSSLPDYIKKLSAALRSKWVAIFNSAMQKHHDEQKAFRIANSAMNMKDERDKKMLALYPTEDQAGFVKLSTDAGKPSRFKKQIFKLGLWKHPLTGQKLEFDRQFAELSVKDTNRFIQAGNQCAFPDEHSGTTRSNYGWWAPEFAIENGWVSGVAEIPDAKDAELLSVGKVKYVSPAIQGSAQDAAGNTYNNLMYHVCATLRPVTPGQKGFERIELAMHGAKQAISLLSYEYAGGKLMLLKNIAVKLGLGDDADEKAILEAIDVLHLSATNENPQIMKLSALVEASNAKVAALQEKLDRAAKQQSESYMLSVQQQAVEYGVPLTKEQTDKIQKYLDKGFVDEARELGTAYLAVSEAKSTKPKHTTHATHDRVEPDASAKAAQEVAEIAARRRMLEAGGFEVKLSADGRNIENVAAPAKRELKARN